MTSTALGRLHRVHRRPATVPEFAPRRAAEELLPRPTTVASSSGLHRARCACQHCGAHTFTNVGYTIAGNCPNCGSFELVPIEGS